MTLGRPDLTVREAVGFHVTRRLGLVDGHERRPAREQRIVLQSGIARS